MADLPEHEIGSGNVFRDLGLADAEELSVRAFLVRQIKRRVAELGITQTAAAARLGIGQPDLSKLFRGAFDKYDVESLMRFLTRLDYEVEIVVREKGVRRAELTVPFGTAAD